MRTLKYTANPASDFFVHCVEVVDTNDKTLISSRPQMAPQIDWCTTNVGEEFGNGSTYGVWYLAGWGSCFFFEKERDALLFYMTFAGQI